ncbi:MAG: glycine--tRNA ligase subunit beta [Rhodopseudomonas palustris]|nr:glycine--tRNA ligase subunit beta [Rhodopseudomonas palustris]
MPTRRCSRRSPTWWSIRAPLCGTFERATSSTLPREVLVTTMRSHQRYFTVESAEGRLLHKLHHRRQHPRRRSGRGRQGNERVLRARFSDATFFFEEDRKATLDDAPGRPEERDLPGKARHLLREGASASARWPEAGRQVRAGGRGV